MKKLILTPRNDTVTICLPEDWVGKPLECILRHPDEKTAYPEDLEIVSELREETILYRAERFRRKRSNRNKRLRKRE
ncbi:MAG: hypothetical protein SPL42_07695 [Bacteroidales bacterium]|nr:hypothetical protein [Bacteroidales bacterium]MDY6348291.1 hypothetical protein [Bacteroidales bacterium]